MLLPRDRGFIHRRPSEITPRAVFEKRRSMLAGLGAMAVFGPRAARAQGGAKAAPLTSTRSTVPGAIAMDKATPVEAATSYNNFYEFGTDKSDPAQHAHRLKTRPWTVAIEGEVKKPGPIDIEDLLKLGAMEERIYRLRCVEGWSMVIPWIGYSLSALIQRVEPNGNARFVEFVTLADREQMPGLSSSVLQWPYVEGLRIDEAMHPLAMLAFGMYGHALPNQNGAPLRLMVPWKYGFKSAKSIVRIRFVRQQPATSWSLAAPEEYGFYSNVNPTVDHPRWSQATERRLGDGDLFAKKRPTLMFNGYAAQVGSLYTGMDLKKFF